MEYRNFTVCRDDDDRRLDRVLRKFLPDLPLSAVYRLLRNGRIRVDGARAKPDVRVKEGQTLMIPASLDTTAHRATIEAGPFSRPIETAASKIRVVLETPDLIILNKPAGIPVHGEGGLDRIVPQASGAEESLSFRSGPLHRLDKGTTGLIAFSRSLAGARWFSSAISESRIGKEYLGLAEGVLEESVDWTGADELGRLMSTRATPLAASSAAGTRGLTLVSFRILTGRKHQIRIQTSEHGHPLIGDTRYGGGNDSPAGARSWLLHSWKMTFPSDRLEGLPAELVAPVPCAFARAILKTFGPNVLALFDHDDLY